MAQRVTPKQLANLKPIKTLSKEEAKRRGHNGAIKSAQVRREKKLLTQMYADWLVENHKIQLGKKEVELPADEIIKLSVTRNIMATGTSASVAMLKEIADRTEGASGSGTDAAKKDADLLSSLMGAPSSPNEALNDKQGE